MDTRVVKYIHNGILFRGLKKRKKKLRIMKSAVTVEEAMKNLPK